MQQYLKFITSRLCTGQHFQAFSRPSSEPQQLQKQLVVVGSARPRPTALLPARSNGENKGCYCSCWAPDNGREDARNML